MKNRKKSHLLNKPVTKRSDSYINVGNNSYNFGNKNRRSVSTTSLQKNFDFWQSHSATFQASNTYGDADTFFRKSLRNYNQFDTTSIEKFLRSSIVSKKTTKKSSSTKTINFKKHVTVLENDELDDVDVFYSPGSDKMSENPESPVPIVEEPDDTPDPNAPTEPGAVSVSQDLETTPTDAAPIVEEPPDTPQPPPGETTEEETDDEMRQVEEIIKQASDELKQVAEENQQLLQDMGEEEQAEAEVKTTTPTPGGGEGSVFQFDPTIDSAVLKELEEAERQAKETAKIITELKGRVTELLKKEKCSEAEAKELEEKNAELKAQMMCFEEKTKRIQFLIAQTNLFSHMVLPQTPLQTKHDEDCLPKVIVCGATCDNMPKLIMCDVPKSKKKICKSMQEPGQPLASSTQKPDQFGHPLASSTQKQEQFGHPLASSTQKTDQFGHPLASSTQRTDQFGHPLASSTQKPICPRGQQGNQQFAEYGDVQITEKIKVAGAVPQIAKRLSDSYFMQERLAVENANLEGMRYKLQSDLLNKDQTIEYLQRKLGTIQCEMRMICKENSVLNEKINQIICGKNQDEKTVASKKMICGKKRGDCPADLECRLNEYSETTKQLEKQLCDMENDVKCMHNELQAVQAEREHLEQHRNIVICPPICLPHPPCAPAVPCASPRPCDQALRELREQYNRLQDDFKSKVTEVGGLRADNEKLKIVAKEAEDARKSMEEKVKECDKMMKSMKNEKNQFLGSKEQLVEQEQQLVVAKQRFREAQDELEELRLFIQEQQGQMDDYRNKYLEAEQKVEEQRRHIDMLEMDATRINEQVNLEIQRVKGQFQEKLQELMPLPDMLKTTQLKLNEAQQMHLLAERNCEAMEKELNVYKEKVAAITNQMEKVRSDQALGEDEKTTLESRVELLQVQLKQLQDGNDLLSEELTKAEDLIDEKDLEIQAKMHEIAQLQAQLESVREESARQVARNKERCETVRRSMQNQISDLERQLVQSRAQAKAAQKDRDEIRQKMQQQINNLHENFEDAQMRIRNLQGHVNFLKVSYPNPVPCVGDSESVASDPCNCP